MKSKLENVLVEKIDNGYMVDVAFNDFKLDGSKEWRTVRRYCASLEEVLEYVKDVMTA